MDIEKLIQAVDTHIDDPNELSKIAIKLGTWMFYQASLMAQADLEYGQAVLTELNRPLEEGEKRPSVAESERAADVKTGNKRAELRLQSEATREVINAIKKRLDVLSDERKEVA